MQFDTFEDGKKWYKDVRKMKDAGEFGKEGLWHYAKLILSHPGMVIDLLTSILPEVNASIAC